MTTDKQTIHATAIVAGTRGILFIGPSGIGKSSLAFACLNEARASRQFAALVADDRVFIDLHGGCAVARCPDAIKGRLELRFGDIVPFESQPAVVLDYAVLPVNPESADRLPPENERFVLGENAELPLLRLPLATRQPLAFLEYLFLARRGSTT